MENFLAVIALIDPRFTIGWALLWFGIGVMLTASIWGWQKWRETKRAQGFMKELFSQAQMGHVIDIHPVVDSPGMKHAHCLCGATSLVYANDDPSAESLMEQWSENHIDSLMESSGR